MFRNPRLARTYRLIAEGGGAGLLRGRDRRHASSAYFKRIGGWMTKADLAAHHTEWVEPAIDQLPRRRRLGPAAQQPGPGRPCRCSTSWSSSTSRAWASSRPQRLHHQVEAKRLAFEDRARYYADPAFYKQPTDWLISKDYAARARQADPAGPDPARPPIAGQAPSHGDTTYFTRRRQGRDDGLDHPVQLPRHGLGPDAGRPGLHVPEPRRAVRPARRPPERLCAGQAAVPDHHPGLRHPGRRAAGWLRRHGRRHAAAGPGPDHLQPGRLRPRPAGGRRRAPLAPRGRPRADRRGPGHGIGRAATWRPACRRATQTALAGARLEARRRPTAATAATRPSSAGPGRYAAATEMRKDGVALAVLMRRTR